MPRLGTLPSVKDDRWMDGSGRVTVRVSCYGFAARTPAILLLYRRRPWLLLRPGGFGGWRECDPPSFISDELYETLLL